MLVLARPVLLAVFFVLTGCVNLVADYDEILDRQLTGYQEDTDRFLLKMARTAGTPEGAYERNAAFYDEARAQLSTLLVRAEARPKNELTAAQLNNLDSYLTELENLHRGMGAQGLNPAIVSRIRQSNRQAIGAVLALELVKKRGGR